MKKENWTSQSRELKKDFFPQRKAITAYKAVKKNNQLFLGNIKEDNQFESPWHTVGGILRVELARHGFFSF